LNIPGPDDGQSAAAKMIAEQKTPAVPQSAPALVAAAGAAGPAMANR
jgi:hypothetical protein